MTTYIDQEYNDYHRVRNRRMVNQVENELIANGLDSTRIIISYPCGTDKSLYDLVGGVIETYYAARGLKCPPVFVSTWQDLPLDNIR